MSRRRPTNIGYAGKGFIKTHGMTGTRVHRIWSGMLSRCLNANNKDFGRYGGRGISVCSEWLEFKNFLRDMGRPDPEMTIDRIDSDGDYCKENCRWATRFEQARNTSRNRPLTLDGKTMLLKDWAEQIGITKDTLRERLEKWPLERALTQKKMKSRFG